MNRKIALIFVLTGLVLLAFGFYAYDFTNAPISHAITGGSKDVALGFIISGLLGAITGASALRDGPSRQS